MDHGVVDDDEIRQALAGLQLPHMPENSVNGEPELLSSSSAMLPPDSAAAIPEQSSSNPPTIRILVVADIDLPSASELAEYTLQQQRRNKNRIFDAGRIDLCIACGSFCRDDNLHPYQTASAARRRRRYGGGGLGSSGSASCSDKESVTISASVSQQQQCFQKNTPFFRSREETAALEGLMTAALSQLESIVCRVVYCPGSTDPLTTLVSSSVVATKKKTNRGAAAVVDSSSSPFSSMPSTQQSSSSSSTTLLELRPRESSLRLTPNSRNIHQEWLPTAPGLGVAGLLYLESSEKVIVKARHRKSSMSSSTMPPPNRNRGDSGGGGSSITDGSSRPRRNTGGTATSLLGGAVSDESNDDEDCGDGPGRPMSDEDEDANVDGTTANAASPNQDAMMILAEHLVSIQQSSEGYCSTLSRLLQLASPPHHPGPPFAAEQAQSILVTHYVDLDAPLIDDSDDDEMDNDYYHDNNSDNHYDKNDQAAAAALPWPKHDHAAFLNSLLVQKLMCLEVASGSASACPPPRLMKKGRTHVLLPGSLRKRGEFSIVDLSLTPDDGTILEEDSLDKDEDDDGMDELRRGSLKHHLKKAPAAAAASSTSTKPPVQPRYSWRVSNVEFHNVNNLP